MIKGVNRQVLEIKDTGCEYFTQALFFVDPKFSTLPEKTLREKAEASLKDPPGVPVSKKQKALKIILKITNIAAAAGAGHSRPKALRLCFASAAEDNMLYPAHFCWQ